MWFSKKTEILKGIVLNCFLLCFFSFLGQPMQLYPLKIKKTWNCIFFFSEIKFPRFRFSFVFIFEFRVFEFSDFRFSHFPIFHFSIFRFPIFRFPSFPFCNFRFFCFSCFAFLGSPHVLVCAFRFTIFNVCCFLISKFSVFWFSTRTWLCWPPDCRPPDQWVLPESQNRRPATLYFHRL